MGGAGLSGWDSHSRGKEVGNGRKDLFKSWLNTLIVNRETNRQRTEGPCDLWYCIAGLRGEGGIPPYSTVLCLSNLSQVLTPQLHYVPCL
jgi:hypothetical protein